MKSIDLNSTLERWLETGGSTLQEKIVEEIGNRLNYYPALGKILRKRPIDIHQLTTEALECWVLDRYSKMRLSAFTRNVGYAQELITHLIDALPEHPDEIAWHIDEFIKYAAANGFVDEKGHKDLAGAATFASLVLTAHYPEIFIDYPSHKRWRNFVQRLGYVMPDFDTHGQRIVWVSDFAQEIVAQHVFRLKWPETEALWIVSALCWSSGREQEEAIQPPTISALAPDAQESVPSEFDVVGELRLSSESGKMRQWGSRTRHFIEPGNDA